MLSHSSRVLRPKRIPSFGDSGHLIQRALEASLARHTPVSGHQIQDNDPKNGLPTSQNTGSSYNLIRWRFLENGSELKNDVQVCCKSIFEPERGYGGRWRLRGGGGSDLLEDQLHHGDDDGGDDGDVVMIAMRLIIMMNKVTVMIVMMMIISWFEENEVQI